MHHFVEGWQVGLCAYHPLSLEDKEVHFRPVDLLVEFQRETPVWGKTHTIASLPDTLGHARQSFRNPLLLLDWSLLPMFGIVVDHIECIGKFGNVLRDKLLKVAGCRDSHRLSNLRKPRKK